MILNSVKSTVLESTIVTLPLGAVTVGIALVVGVSTAPAVAGAAIAATAFMASKKVYGLIRDAIFKNRVEGLEKYAKGLGLNPDSFGANVLEINAYGDQRNGWMRISRLMEEKEQVRWNNEDGDVCDRLRISREAVAEAKEHMQIMARNNRPTPIMQTLGGGSRVMADIATNKESRVGFFSEAHLQDIHQNSDDDTSTFRMRP